MEQQEPVSHDVEDEIEEAELEEDDRRPTAAELFYDFLQSETFQKVSSRVLDIASEYVKSKVEMKKVDQVTDRSFFAWHQTVFAGLVVLGLATVGGLGFLKVLDSVSTGTLIGTIIGYALGRYRTNGNGNNG